MRLSRVLLAGVAVAGVAATTSAFTASNTVPASTAGYAAAQVTGATATKIAYVLDGTDKSLADGVNFEVTQDVTGMQTFLTLRTGGNTGTVVGGAAITCTVGARTNGTTTATSSTQVSPITCPLDNQPLVGFDSIALTVAQ